MTEVASDENVAVMSDDVVLVDADGVAVGRAPKTTVHHHDTPLHLAFSSYLVDARGHVLLTQRAMSKTTWPGAWTNSCCGHPIPGEPIDNAVRRRVREELAVPVERVDLIVPLFRYRAVMENGIVENEICPVFRVWSTHELTLNPSEVAEARWLPWEDVLMTALDAKRAAPWFRAQVTELDRLGTDPRCWAIADAATLPLAAREPIPIT